MYSQEHSFKNWVKSEFVTTEILPDKMCPSLRFKSKACLDWSSRRCNYATTCAVLPSSMWFLTIAFAGWYIFLYCQIKLAHCKVRRQTDHYPITSWVLRNFSLCLNHKVGWADVNLQIWICTSSLKYQETQRQGWCSLITLQSWTVISY